MAAEAYMTAKQAAAALGVRVETLYAYVSRGLVRSQQGADQRSRTYLREDIEALVARKAQRRNPQRAMREALHWGGALLESELTLIADGRLYYRGKDALQLAREASVEQVAALLWTGDAGAGMAWPRWAPGPHSRALGAMGEGLDPVALMQALMPLAEAEDWRAYDLEPDAVVAAGSRIVAALAWAVCGEADLSGGVAAALQRAWGPKRKAARGLLSAALVLSADHELNVSSFAGRCVASAKATPYAVVAAGLAALKGAQHGGIYARVDGLLHEIESGGDPRRVMAERLRRGEGVPGVGHRLYPQGDPRGALLLELVAAGWPRSRAAGLGRAVAAAADEVLHKAPNLDIGLALVARVLGLPPQAAQTLFALGRSLGWIAHALEQYRSERLIRPRAQYAGPRPELVAAGE